MVLVLSLINHFHANIPMPNHTDNRDRPLRQNALWIIERLPHDRGSIRENSRKGRNGSHDSSSLFFVREHISEISAA
jgi:hypothetical protein